jgi:hypothetical protein
MNFLAFSAFFAFATMPMFAGTIAVTDGYTNSTGNPEALAARTLRATPDGVELVSAGSKTTKTWDRVSGIEVTPERAFVAIDGEYAVVLPRLRLGDETYQRLIETIRRLSHLPL